MKSNMDAGGHLDKMHMTS